MLASSPAFGALFKCAMVNDALDGVHTKLRQYNLGAKIEEQWTIESKTASGGVTGLIRPGSSAAAAQTVNGDGVAALDENIEIAVGHIGDHIANHGERLELFGFKVTLGSILVFCSVRVIYWTVGLPNHAHTVTPNTPLLAFGSSLLCRNSM